MTFFASFPYFSLCKVMTVIYHASTQRWTARLFHFLVTAKRSSKMLCNNISFVYLWPNENKQCYIQKRSASGSRFQPKECRCCYELRFSRGRWSVQTNTWLSEPQGSKVRRKCRGSGQRAQRNLSCSFGWSDLLSMMNEMMKFQVSLLILKRDDS